MEADKWNRTAKVTLIDRALAATVLRLIPNAVRPNHLTVLRILMIPVVLWTLIAGRYDWGIALFFVAGVTDMLDGALARTRRQITEWGILYDPLADKLLIGSVLALVVLRHINLFLGLALLAVEAFIVVGAALRRRYGVLVPANGWGKAKMVTEVVGILVLLAALALHVNLLVDVSQGVLAVALVTALASLTAKSS